MIVDLHLFKSSLSPHCQAGFQGRIPRLDSFLPDTFKESMAKRQGQIYIGTSNIVVPGNKKSFPPEFQTKSRLNYYSSLFNSLEVNSSFYKIPMRSTFEKWSLDVPEDFHFSLKLTKEITHIKNLDADLTYIDKFMSAATGIGTKKGSLLIQFPGKITLDYFNQVETIIEELNHQDLNNEWKKAIEFRSSTWYIGETFELLDQHNIALVLHDISKGKIEEIANHATFVYVRFHGPTGNYRDSYDDKFLQQKAREIKSWAKSGKDVYAYFNNTIGNAFENAKTLKSMV